MRAHQLSQPSLATHQTSAGRGTVRVCEGLYSHRSCTTQQLQWSQCKICHVRFRLYRPPINQLDSTIIYQQYHRLISMPTEFYLHFLLCEASIRSRTFWGYLRTNLSPCSSTQRLSPIPGHQLLSSDVWERVTPRPPPQVLCLSAHMGCQAFRKSLWCVPQWLP